MVELLEAVVKLALGCLQFLVEAISGFFLPTEIFCFLVDIVSQVGDLQIFLFPCVKLGLNSTIKLLDVAAQLIRSSFFRTKLLLCNVLPLNVVISLVPLLAELLRKICQGFAVGVVCGGQRSDSLIKLSVLLTQVLYVRKTVAVDKVAISLYIDQGS